MRAAESNNDTLEREKLADELDRLLKQINDLASRYPMTETERDAHGAAVIQLMALHARVTIPARPVPPVRNQSSANSTR